MSGEPNWLFSVFSCIGFILVLIPLPWHFEAWNSGTCLYMFWVSLACLNLFINSILWSGNAVNWAPVWCDISSRIMIGAACGIPAASLCIMRRLYHIASVRCVTISRTEKRRAIMVDLAIGLLYPLVEIGLYYVVEGHRFDIYEDIGCWFAIYNTWVGLLLVECPPILVSFITVIYAILTIRTFYRTRSQSVKMLSGYSNLTRSRYLRLMALAGSEIVISFPLYVTEIYLTVVHKPSPWISWEDTHSYFSHINQWPSIIWRSNSITVATLSMDRWFAVVCAFMFFGFFGFADEARKNYSLAFTAVTKRVGISTGGTMTSSSNTAKFGFSHSGSLPDFTTEQLDCKKPEGSLTDSGASFRDVDVDGSSVSKMANTVDIAKKHKVFSPTFNYNDLALPDLGGVLTEKSQFSDTGLGTSSNASSLTIPESVITRSEAGGADVSSLCHTSRTNPEITITQTDSESQDPRRNSHDIV